MPFTEADLDDLMSVDEAATFLHVHRSTINRMIARREVDVVRIGSGRGRVRLTKRALLDHLNRNLTKAEKPKRSA